MARLRSYFPYSHGAPRVVDRRVLSEIVVVNRDSLRWRDAPRKYGSHKTLYNRRKRWSDMEVFARIITGFAAEVPDNRSISIAATYLGVDVQIGI